MLTQTSLKFHILYIYLQLFFIGPAFPNFAIYIYVSPIHVFFLFPFRGPASFFSILQTTNNFTN